jgi:hypothetical protein
VCQVSVRWLYATQSGGVESVTAQGLWDHRGPARAEGEVKHSLRALRLSAVLLAGCGVTLSQSDWRGPAGSNCAKDSYECERDARLAVGSGGRETFREVRSRAEQCMVARGYSKLPAPR